MGNRTVATNNFFNYGEVGKRLAGIRESEIAKGSAQIIKNLYVTELGNLKVAKKFAVKNNTINNILEVIDTRYEFYVIVCTANLYTVRKTDNVVLYSIACTATNGTNIKMFEDRLVICTSTPQCFEFNKTTGAVGTSNFFSLLTFPVLEKEIVKLEVFKVYEITVGTEKEMRVTSLAKYENPKLEVKADGVYLESSNIKLERIYRQARSSIDSSTITGVKAGMVIAVMERFLVPVTEDSKIKKYILGNSVVDFTGETNDPLYGGSYFTGISVQTKGQLTWGELKNVSNNFIDAGVYGPRFYIIKDDIIFFSKIDNFFDFRNDIKDDSPFYFKPGPINNQRPKYLTTKTGNALYLTTNKGVYVINYDKVLTPSSYRVFVASEIPSKFDCELIGDNFYFVSEDNVLKCIQPVPNQLGYESYKTFIVEKFSLGNYPAYLTKIIIDGVTKLVNQPGGNIIEIYDVIDINIFRKTSLELDYTSKLFGYNQNFVHNLKFLEKTNINYERSYLYLNTPYTKTTNGGTYANDYNTIIDKVDVKILNEANEALKGMFIAETPCSNLSKDEDDFSLYRVKTSKKILNGYKIELVSKENDKILEILGIDTYLNVNGDA
ncbi:MAG: hypothetical protein ACRCZ2_06725 [Fusobacteriaceae bacterium]